MIGHDLDFFALPYFRSSFFLFMCKFGGISVRGLQALG